MIFLSSISNRFPKPFQFYTCLFSRFQITFPYSLNQFPQKNLKNTPVSDNNASISKSDSRVSPNSNNNQCITTNSTHLDLKTVQETISSYNNDWKRAFEFFNYVENEYQFKHTIDTYNQVIDILGKFFEFNLAWDLIERMPSTELFAPDHTTFRIMFKRCASAHMVREAIDTYDRAEEFNLKDETSFCNLIDALCEYKHVIEAQELCIGKNSPPFPLNTKMYNMILRGWSKMGWWSKCREFREEMGRKGVSFDLHSYSIYMDILCKSGKPWKTVKLYKEMKEMGIQLDVVAYNTVIHAAGLCDGVDVSVQLYREMLDLGCKPNIVTYNTIVKLLCQSGRIRHAYALLDEMPVKGCAPNAITYHCFFGCLNRPKEILQLFDRMIQSGVCPRMDTYVMLIRKFGRWGFLRPVFVVWKKMEEHGRSPDEFAYNALIDALLQNGMVEMAREYDEEMLAKGLSAKPRKELGTALVSEDFDDDHL